MAEIRHHLCIKPCKCREYRSDLTNWQTGFLGFLKQSIKIQLALPGTWRWCFGLCPRGTWNHVQHPGEPRGEALESASCATGYSKCMTDKWGCMRKKVYTIPWPWYLGPVWLWNASDSSRIVSFLKSKDFSLYTRHFLTSTLVHIEIQTCGCLRYVWIALNNMGVSLAWNTRRGYRHNSWKKEEFSEAVAFQCAVYKSMCCLQTAGFSVVLTWHVKP